MNPSSSTRLSPGPARRTNRLAWLAPLILLGLSACDASPENAGATEIPAAAGPEISTLLVGNNVWLNPSDQVWDVTGQAQLGLVRIGGIRYDNEMPSTSQLTEWVDRIKSIGAEPMLQVSRHDGPAAAAALVQHFNVDSGNRVTYWNIGNEPHCGENTVAAAADVAAYIKEIAPAMKAVDPSIRIFAPDECDFLGTYYGALFSGNGDASDVSGRIPGADYFYVDGVSWHRYVGYPPANLQTRDLPTAGAQDFAVRIERTRELIDAANAARGRTGDDALQWGIGEFNSSEGGRVCSFENGQMFAQVYRYVMKYGGTYAATWSMFENGGRCEGTDYSFVNSDMTPRSSYYHLQMISRHFSGYYLDGTSNTEGIRAFGAFDPERGRIAVMLLNVDADQDHTCILRLNTRPATSDACQINIPAERDVEHELTLDRQSTFVTVFDLEGNPLSTERYARLEEYRRNQPPTASTQ